MKSRSDYLRDDTLEAEEWRKSLQVGYVDGARSVRPRDDRDTTLDSRHERGMYGLPEEDFEKDCHQLAFLLGGTLRVYQGALTCFLWPKVLPENNVNHAFPLNALQVSTSPDGVTITLRSRFVTREAFTDPWLWTRLEEAIEQKWGIYEAPPSAGRMRKRLEDRETLNDTPREFVEDLPSQKYDTLVEQDQLDKVRNIQKSRRARAKRCPRFWFW